MSEQRELLPCPFCGGKCDPDGWMNDDEITGPECEDCGATALNVGLWNHRIRPPGEASEGDVALVRMAVMGVPGWRVSDRNDSIVGIADRIARAAISALPAPPEREALKEALALLAKAGDQLEGYGIVSNTLERARGKLSALLGEEK